MEGHSVVSCNRCRCEGVVIEPRGSWAEASLCDCSRHCSVCRGARFLVERDDFGREIARMCDCEMRRRRVRFFNDAGVPAKFYDARLEDGIHDKHNKVAFSTFRLLADEYHQGHKGILLMGPSGVGKTFLVAAFIHEIIIKKGVPAQFRDFFHLLSDLRSGYSQGKAESELIGPLADVELLVIDELGKGRNTAWEQNILDSIISQRYNNRRTTIFTSNYTESRSTTLPEKVRSKELLPEGAERETRDTLLDRVGPRIFSRLKEMCDFVTLLGPDRRGVEGS